MENDQQIRKLIKQIKLNANKKAANTLVKFYYREMLGYVYNRTHDKDVAMDISQEIFVSSLQSIDNFDENRSTFRTWLYTIAGRRIADYYRSSAFSKSQLTDSDNVVPEQKLEIQFERSLQIKEIREFVDGLEQSRQEIFKLKVFNDYTFGKIAEITGLPEATVKTKFYATQKMIRKEFADDGG